MKIRVKVGDLTEQITQAAITIDHKAGDLPSGKVYQRAKINSSTDGGKPALYLFSTDQASKTLIRLDVEAVDLEGQTLIDPAKLLAGLLNRDPGQIVELEVMENKSKVRMKIGKNIVHLPYEDSVNTAVATIKSLPSGSPIAKISAKTLLEFIRRSLFCIPTLDNGQQKFAMGVLNLKGGNGYYTAQATDGYTIARHVARQSDTTKCDLPSLLIPVEALNPLSKLLQRYKDTDVDILAGKRDSASSELQEVFFRMEKVLFGTVLKVGAYPNVQVLLDQHAPSFEIEVPKEELKWALMRATNFVESKTDSRTVQLTADTTLKIEARNDYSDIADELDIKGIKGTASVVKVAVNVDYLLNIASMQIGDRVSLGFNTDKMKALSAKDTSEADMETRYAIMPIMPEAKLAKEKKTKAPAPEAVEVA